MKGMPQLKVPKIILQWDMSRVKDERIGFD
jgi:hypothetical protein